MDGHWVVSNLLVIMNDAALKVYVQDFVWMCIFIFLEYVHLGVELLRHMAAQRVTFCGTARLFPKAPTLLFHSHQELPVLAHHSYSSLNIT